ncbi:hypothetical protein HN873_017387 [Arachis hypogaea]
MKPSMCFVMIKCLVSLSAMMILVTALHPQDAKPLPSALDSPPPPQSPPNCDEKCSTQCAQNGICSRMLCYGVCMAECTILPLHANSPCTQNSVVINTIHHKPYEKHIGGIVNHC